MIRDENRHIPVSRRTLLEYLESGDTTYRTRDGQECSMEKEDIDILAKYCTEIEKMRLRIPIFISTDINSSVGAWKVEGKAEVAVVSKILGKKAHKEDLLQLFFPDYHDLRKMMPSVIFEVFAP